MQTRAAACFAAGAVKQLSRDCTLSANEESDTTCPPRCRARCSVTPASRPERKTGHVTPGVVTGSQRGNRQGLCRGSSSRPSKLLSVIMASAAEERAWLRGQIEKKEEDAVSYTHLTLPTKRIV